MAGPASRAAAAFPCAGDDLPDAEDDADGLIRALFAAIHQRRRPGSPRRQ